MTLAKKLGGSVDVMLRVSGLETVAGEGVEIMGVDGSYELFLCGGEWGSRGSQEGAVPCALCSVCLLVKEKYSSR